MRLNSFDTLAFYKRYIEDLLTCGNNPNSTKIGVVGTWYSGLTIVKLISELECVRDKYDLVYFTTDRYDPSGLSKFVKKQVNLPDPNIALSTYQKMIDDEELGLLIVTGDECVHLTSPSDYSPSGVKTSLCGPSTTSYKQLHSAKSFTNVLKKCGLNHAPVQQITDPEEYQLYDIEKVDLVHEKVINSSSNSDLCKDRWYVRERRTGEWYSSVSVCIDSKVFGTVVFRSNYGVNEEDIVSNSSDEKHDDCFTESNSIDKTPSVMNFAGGVVDDVCSSINSTNKYDVNLSSRVHSIARKIAGETGFTGFLCLDYVREPDTKILTPIKVNNKNIVGLNFVKESFYRDCVCDELDNDLDSKALRRYFHNKIVMTPHVLLYLYKNMSVLKSVTIGLTTLFSLVSMDTKDPFLTLFDPLPWLFTLIRVVMNAIVKSVRYFLLRFGLCTAIEKDKIDRKTKHQHIHKRNSKPQKCSPGEMLCIDGVNTDNSVNCVDSDDNDKCCDDVLFELGRKSDMNKSDVVITNTTAECIRRKLYTFTNDDHDNQSDNYHNAYKNKQSECDDVFRCDTAKLRESSDKTPTNNNNDSNPFLNYIADLLKEWSHRKKTWYGVLNMINPVNLFIMYINLTIRFAISMLNPKNWYRTPLGVVRIMKNYFV
ncbi:hypothetical protein YASMINEVIRUS_1348 [Yasminevirus sp. GU-2018]|uniref:Uncharacterized protein n=1 Tax=Yasminevirus sp. GU-2018 TaxID=2420051 RepID=A0A5K0UC30_9VIRU|nr:hypothetical protein YASMINEVIRUS_1348 [Yasminevirus sp. GU-2018]